jgi:hypothetical protein
MLTAINMKQIQVDKNMSKAGLQQVPYFMILVQ